MELNVYVLHVLASNNRRWAFMGSASMQQIPEDVIYFAVSPNLSKFDNNINVVAQAASNDGFPYLKRYGRGAKNMYVQQSASSMGQIWNYCRIFRHIIQTGVSALVIHDDRMISINWDSFNIVINELESKGDFKIFQTRQRHGQPIGIKEQLEILSQHTFDKDDPLNYVTSGINGYEEGMVISPLGAEFILNALENNIGDYYFFDDFVHTKLSKLCTDISGVYTTTKDEFCFIREYLEFPSLTDWAHNNSPYFNDSQKATNINFLDLNNGI